MHITKVSMFSFSIENPMKTATLQNLYRFLLQSKILSVSKINEHMPIPEIHINKKLLPIYFQQKKLLIRYLFPFIQITIFNSEEHSIWPLNIAIKNNYHTYNSFILVVQ